MRIIVDIDNVICDFVSAMIEYTNSELGTSFTSEDWQVWDFVDSPKVNVKREKMMVLFDDFFASDRWHNAKLYNDSLDVLSWLDKEHNFVYLTNRPLIAKDCTLEYFSNEGLPLSGSEILDQDGEFTSFDHGKIFFSNGIPKHRFARFHNVDVVVEDNPETVQGYLDSGVKTILKLEPYNNWVDFSDPQKLLTRCNNLTEFKQFIINLEKEKDETQVHCL